MWVALGGASSDGRQLVPVVPLLCQICRVTELEFASRRTTYTWEQEQKKNAFPFSM